MDDLFATAGDLVDAYAAVDWAQTPLGDSSTWSPTLRATVTVMLKAEFPITLLWGPEFVLVYNAPYVELIGDKHPASLGMPAQAVFPEVWDQIGPLLHAARDEGRATFIDDGLVPLERHGFLEDCWFRFSYSPVVSPDGTDRGVIDITTETTASVVTLRRLRLLGQLAELLAGVERPQDVPVQSLLLLRAASDDLVEVDLSPAGDAWHAAEEASAPGGRRDLLVEDGDDGPRVWLALRSANDDGPVDLETLQPTDARPLLVVRPSPRLPLDDDHLVFLRLVAATLAQALDRVEALASERRVAAAERAMSETLQRSLLGVAQSGPGAQVAVRYQPVVDLAEIGGDWYDAFPLADGRLAAVIGDVAGHDRQAAAAMAQTRNLLRAIAYTVDGGPAAALTALDAALSGLEVGSFATGILALLAAPGADRPDGTRRFTWANAGHPPPVLLTPDGEARLLWSTPELLLGMVPDPRRTDQHVDLAPGSSVLLFTDGLIERRTRPLDAGLAMVVDAVRGRTDLDPEELCDHVLAEAHAGHDDDIALLCLRVG